MIKELILQDTSKNQDKHDPIAISYYNTNKTCNEKHRIRKLYIMTDRSKTRAQIRETNIIARWN